MTDLHLIIPPEELVDKWVDEYYRAKVKHHNLVIYIAGKASKWSADAELDACCEWFQEFYKTESWVTHDLKHFRDARRPKPLSETDQALAALREAEASGHLYVNGRSDTIRRALERLKELEAAQ